MNYIVLDLDNCIADDRWRVRLINPAHADPYHNYHTMASRDAVGNRHLFERTPHEIVICTGRPDTYRTLTASWLAFNQILVRDVLMRPAGDTRPSPEMKWALLFRYMVQREHDGGRCVMAYDDRADVVAQYHRMGLPATRAWLHTEGTP
jgi:hypothetical protein